MYISKFTAYKRVSDKAAGNRDSRGGNIVADPPEEKTAKKKKGQGSEKPENSDSSRGFSRRKFQ